MVAAGLGAVVMTVAGLLAGPAPDRRDPSTRPSATDGARGFGGPNIEKADTARAESGADLLTYAVDTRELSGLPPNAPPGTSLQLWVLWRPPAVHRPRLELLLDGVTLERILPPLTSEDPHVALMLVTKKQAADLIYADRYGDLSVTIRGAE